MKSLKLGARLIWPQIVILLLLLAGIIAGFVGFTNIRAKIDTLYYSSYVVRNAADSVYKTIESMQTSVYRAILYNSQDITDEAMSDTKNGMEIIEEQIALIRPLPKLEQSLSEIAPMQEHVLSLAVQKKSAEAVQYMEDRVVPVMKEAQQELAQFIQSEDAKEKRLMASLRQTQRETIILLVSLGAACVLFSAGVGAYILRLHKKGGFNEFRPSQNKGDFAV